MMCLDHSLMYRSDVQGKARNCTNGRKARKQNPVSLKKSIDPEFLLHKLVVAAVINRNRRCVGAFEVDSVK